jgi:putative transcriptional regulator
VGADPAVIYDTPVPQRYDKALSLLGIDPRMLSAEAGHA